MKRFDETVKDLAKENDLVLVDEAVSPTQSIFTFKPQYSTTTVEPITVIPKQFPKDSEIYREAYQLYKAFCNLTKEGREVITSNFFQNLSEDEQYNLKQLFDSSAQLREQVSSFITMIMYGKRV